MRQLRPLPQLVCGQRAASHAGRVTERRGQHNGNWRRSGNGDARRAATLTVTGTLDQALRLVGAASATPTAVTTEAEAAFVDRRGMSACYTQGGRH